MRLGLWKFYFAAWCARISLTTLDGSGEIQGQAGADNPHRIHLRVVRGCRWSGHRRIGRRIGSIQRVYGRGVTGLQVGAGVPRGPGGSQEVIVRVGHKVVRAGILLIFRLVVHLLSA